MNAIQYTLQAVAREVADQARRFRLAELPTVFALLPPTTAPREDEVPREDRPAVG